jgi:aldehyde dehydrogenase (NAD+)
MTDDDISYSFYIDGRWVRSPHAHAVPVINPATEENVAEISGGSAADVDRAVAAAREAFASFAALSVETRAAFLDRIHTLILEGYLEVKSVLGFT